jgi:multiple sugar transport system permease protein
MIWKLGIFCAILSGSVWGTFWQVIFTILGILTTGLQFSLEIAPSLFSGVLIGFIYIIYQKDIQLKQHIIFVVALILLIYGITLGDPYYSKDENIFIEFILVVVTSISMWISIYLTLKNISIGKLSRYQSEKFYIRLLWGLGLITLILITLIPFYIMIMTSLKNQQSLILNPLDLSLDFSNGFNNLFVSYIELFKNYNFHIFLMNSFLVSIVTVLITLLFSIPGAYALARLKFPGKEWFSGSVILIYLIPSIVLVIPLYAVFSQLGLRNSLFGLIIVYPATTIPVALYMLRGYFSTLSSEIDDAAIMDGLSRLQIIYKIAMPLSKPAIVSVALYVFMIAWNEFLFAFMFLDDPNLFTLSRGIISLNSSEVPQQHLMAGAVIATIPIMMIFIYLEKFLISGLTTGSVKG